MLETEASRERWTVKVAVGALVFSGLALVVTSLQWRASERAADVADQARKDANIASDKALGVAERARIDAVIEAEKQRIDAAATLKAQTRRADRANTLADRSAKAAEETAKAAAQQFEMSERPWVITEYVPSAPLEFTPDGGVTFQVLGKLRNIGHSVALHVHDTPLITLQERGIASLHPTESQKDLCDRIRDIGEKFPTFASGETLFPQDIAYENMLLRFSKDDVEKARAGKTDTIVGLSIIGCVDYTFSFSPKHHQTGYIYEIVRRVPGQTGAMLIKIGENVPVNQLVIRRSIFGGFYAD